jgi:hypothetical protein
MADDTPRPFAPGEFETNPDGSWSNEVTRTVNAGEEPGLMGGHATVIPTMWKQGDQTIRADPDQAAELAKNSGLAFPTFASDQDAAEFADKREANWQNIEPGSPAHFAVPPLGAPSTLRPGGGAYNMPGDDYVLPTQNDLHDGMAAGRIAGYSWPEINQFVAERHQASAAAGYSDAEVRQTQGLGEPSQLNDRLRTMMQHNLNSP